MQLHTPQGYRDVHCKACGKHERCLKNLCQCGTVWHRCPLHRVDPQVHATRKGVKKHGKINDEKQNKEDMKLSSWRRAPETIAKEDNHQKATGRRMRRRKITEDEHTRNVKFDTSRAPPAEDILRRIREKASQAHDQHKEEASIEVDMQIETKRHHEHEGGREANRKRKRIDDNCGKDDEHMRRRSRVEVTTRLAGQRKTLIEHLEQQAAQQAQHKNSRMQKLEKAKGDDHRQGDQKAGTSSARGPARANACTLVSRRREGEVESITRLISNLKPP